MFTRVFRTSPPDRRWLKRLGPVGIALALIAAPLALLPLRADAAAGDAVLTEDTTINGCNGVLTTPGSENTTKRLDPNFASDFNPGGVVGYIIDFPVDAGDVGGDFRITDCVYVDPPGAGSDEAIAKYFIDFVPNTEAFQLRFSVDIPAGTPLGSQFCNYAKTTESPSTSQASNRKAGPACFTVGGGLRIEKRSGSTTGPILPGASFSVLCSPTAAQPPTIITGLTNQSVLNGNGTVSATGVASDGTIAINGPSGTPCVVTETAAPDSYLVDPTPRNLVIPVGASQTINVFVNVQLGSLIITKAVVGGTGSFTFDIDCDGEEFDDENVSVVPGTPYVLDGIPVGTVCAVTEDDNGEFTQTSVIPSDGTVTIDADGATVAFVNTRDLGSLTLTKSVVGGAGSFTFDINCSVDSFDRTDVSATPTTPYVLPGIPTGTVCTVTEDANGEFTQTLVVPANGTVTIDSNGETVAFTNTRNTGGLTITKSVVGGAGSFTFDIDCSDNAFDRANVSATPTTPYVLPGIPTGTVCTVTEDDNGDFSQTLVVPANGTVTIDSNGETVAFTNTRKVGSLTISKTANAPGIFTFDVDCTVDSFDRLGLNRVVIVNGGTEVIDNIPTGTTCTVTERDNPLFSSIVIPEDGTVIIHESGETVAFTNTRNTGPLTISKTAIGGTGTFTFDVDCSVDSFDQVVSIEAGASATITEIPTTTSCTVTERENPLFTSSVLPANGTVSIDAGGANVAFVNTARPNGLTIDKKVNGGDHATVADSLLVHANDVLSYTVVITNNGQVPLTITAMSDSLYPALIAACPQAVGSVLAAGASFTCRYGVGAVGDDHNVASVSAIDGLGRPLTGSDGTYVDVLNPAISIVKTASPTSVAVSGPVTYIYVVTNTGDTTLFGVLVTDDILGVIGRIPELAPGESVTLAKTVDVDASTPPTNIGTAVGTDVLGQTVTANDDASITVVLGAVEVAPQELPRTGAPLGAQTRAALVMIQVGLVLTLAGRRRWMVRRAG